MEMTKEEAAARAKQLLRWTALMILFALLAGGVGAWLIYDSMEAGSSIPRFFLILPGLVAVVVVSIPIRLKKNKWFPGKEDFGMALAGKWPPPKEGEENNTGG